MNKPRKALQAAGICVADGPMVPGFEAGPFGRFEYTTQIFKTVEEVVKAARAMIKSEAERGFNPVILLRRDFYTVADPVEDGLLISVRWTVVPDAVCAYTSVVGPAEAQLWKDFERWRQEQPDLTRPRESIRLPQFFEKQPATLRNIAGPQNDG